LKLLSKLGCVGILIGWFTLWGIVFSKLNAQVTTASHAPHNPVQQPWTTIYFTQFQDGFRRWAIPVWLGLALFYWLAEFNLKKHVKNAGPKQPSQQTDFKLTTTGPLPIMRGF